MNIRDRFSENSLLTIKKYIEENEYKSIILKATFDDNELIQEPFFYANIKRKILKKFYLK